MKKNYSLTTHIHIIYCIYLYTAYYDNRIFSISFNIDIKIIIIIEYIIDTQYAAYAVHCSSGIYTIYIYIDNNIYIYRYST